MSCRFAAGIDSPATYWDFMVAGRESVGPVPEGRWDRYATQNPDSAAVLRGTTNVGHFIADIAGFDAEFFRITPREARQMDPQQRMMLEVAWEALENAGIPPADAHTDSGVFVGVGSNDYGRRLLEDLPGIEAWTGIGAALCGVANRTSHALDLHGPSVAVDTACSSSLVAIHQACQTLRLGEAPMALAGGVMLMAGPALSVVLDAAGATAPDGRSKPFDAAADGYGRGEGCGVLVLKRLSDAYRDDHRVLAVIRGSAVAQEGRTDGIMAPSREAQESLLRRTYRHCGVAPETVDYVEAHGTGTPAGDPVEASAIGTVLGVGRPEARPCLIGSVKSNIGHLEAAAGVAGVIKTVLALNRGRIPATCLTTGPSPRIDWAGLSLRLVDRLTNWPTTDHPRRAGVASYGYGGTIAHLVLEEPPRRPPREHPHLDTEIRPYPVSHATPDGVAAQATRLAGWLENAEDDNLLATGRTLAMNRTHMPARAVVMARNRDELLRGWRALAEGRPSNDVLAGPLGRPAPDTNAVWVFSGHGAQWPRMGAGLLGSEPAFAEALDEIDAVFLREMGLSPREVLRQPDLGGVDRVQATIFAVQLGLAAVWRSYGLRPAAVIGHSVGEIAAAVTAGVLSAEEGAVLAARRSRRLPQVAGKGAMAMVSLPFDKAAQRLAGSPQIAAAIATSPSTSVISGDQAALDELLEIWRSEGISVRRIDSDVAFHSHHMSAPAAELACAVAHLRPRPALVPLYSTALEDPRSKSPRDARYWATNLREPVRFEAAVTAALDDGHRVFLEVSAHPVVTHSVEEIIEAAGEAGGATAHTLRRGKPDRPTLLANLGSLHCHGVRVDWNRVFPAAPLAELPVTAWNHRPHLAEPSVPTIGVTSGHDPDSHTLLGVHADVFGTTRGRMWSTRLDETSRPYPGSHPVQGTEIIPAAVLLNTFLATETAAPILRDVRLLTPVPVGAPRVIQVVLQDRVVRLSSRSEDTSNEDEKSTAWLTHTEAVLHTPVPDEACPPAPHSRSPERAEDPGFVINRLASLGVAALGFPWHIKDLRRGKGTLRAEITVDPGNVLPALTWAALLDSAFSVASVVFPDPPRLRMPAHIDEVMVVGPPPDVALIEVSLRPAEQEPDTVDVLVHTTEQVVVARLSGLRYGEFESDDSHEPVCPQRLIHNVTRRPCDLGRTGKHLRSVGVLGTTPLAEALSSRLRQEIVDVRAFGRLDETGDHAPETIVFVAPDTTEPVADQAIANTQAVTRLIHRLGRGKVRLWCVTRGMGEACTATGLAHAPLSGLARVARTEHGDLWGGLIDLPDHPTAEDLSILTRVLRSPSDEPVLHIRDGKVWGTRLVPADAGCSSAPLISCRPEGTYLITGGLGALGMRIAHWLGKQGARRLVLLSRRALPARDRWSDKLDPTTSGLITRIRRLEERGITVRTVSGDVADTGRLKNELLTSNLQLPPILGIVHAAGVVRNEMLHDMTDASIHDVLRPKVAGALALHEMFPPGTLDFLVLFSSAGQLLGLPGQSSYAAANSFLDAMASHRRAEGHNDTVSIAWTSWRGAGMSTSSAAIDVELDERGTADITTAGALKVLARINDRTANLAVLRVLPDDPSVARPAVLRDLAPPAEAPAASTGRGDWARLDGDELRKHLYREVTAAVAAAIGVEPTQVDAGMPLTEMGFDSVMSTGLRRALAKRLRVPVAPTLMWEHPTVTAIAEHFAETRRKP
ncbi:type I polyketide synthase [Amycolatopsis alba DSM 44262]|uniref:Type I polyketide synthase n=2 Tax=Amycolatopsis alba TaxID=76020 RepID=A0A229RL50_AMYAL|nr:type I polyketide synthase [Amycolatopsis alba DSM 44262]